MNQQTAREVYGRWLSWEPRGVAGLLEGSAVRWWIAGGRAARVGAPPRRHTDTDVGILAVDLPALRHHLRRWHLWEFIDGSLRPLLPGDELRPGCEQLWLRRDADHPWILDLLLQWDEDNWIYSRDTEIRVPWAQALHVVGELTFLRPELALLHKAHLDRDKDRADLAAATLLPESRAWLVKSLLALGHQEWANALLLTAQDQDPLRRSCPSRATTYSAT